VLSALSPTRRVRVLCLAGVAALTLTGCATGQHAEVLKEKTAITGTNVDIPRSAVLLRNVYATPTLALTHIVPPGGQLELHLVIYNDGNSNDALVRATANAVTAPTPIALPRGVIPLRANSMVRVGGPIVPAPRWPVTANVLVGTYVPVTLTFASAGTVSVIVPVEYAPTPILS
jgi:copper(I)-binding protein